jgi:DNA-binding response OmpR family regulator
MRQVCQWALEDEGFVVESAGDGGEALRSAHSSRPAVVVLDMTLPGAPGEAVARELRQLHGTALPILVITGDGHATEKAARVGAYGYLSKPFDITDFVALVRQGLAN